MNPFTIFLPPLRERFEDIPLLVDYFLKSNDAARKQKIKFSPAALRVLQEYHWPGNVRELKGVVSYAVHMTQSPSIDPGSLPKFLFLNLIRRNITEGRLLVERWHHITLLNLYAHWNGN